LLAGNNFQFRFPIREPDVWNLAVLTRNELVASAFAVGCERVSGEAESLKVTDGNQYLAKPRKVGVKRPISSRKTPALLNRLLRIGGDKDKGDQPLFAIASSSLALGAVGVLTTVATGAWGWFRWGRNPASPPARDRFPHGLSGSSFKGIRQGPRSQQSVGLEDPAKEPPRDTESSCTDLRGLAPARVAPLCSSSLVCPVTKICESGSRRWRGDVVVPSHPCPASAHPGFSQPLPNITNEKQLNKKLLKTVN
jgi:hypothetical protein